MGFIKLICILFLLALVRPVGQCQGFGGLGAQWKHCLTPDMKSDPVLIKVEVEDPIVIQGLNCYVLRSNDITAIGAVVDSIVICNFEDKVYYVEGDSLYLLYDFSLGEGDQLELNFRLT